MKAYTTPNGRKLLNKFCPNCKHFGYKMNIVDKELVEFCLKRKEIITDYDACKEFIFINHNI